MINSKEPPPARRIIQGDVVKVVWKDAIEGTVQQDIANLGESQIRSITTAIISTVGRYLKVSNGYLILDEVFHEESNGQLVYEKQATGKWLAIPLGVICQVSHTGEELNFLTNAIKRRRVIIKQLRFIPRMQRLPTGKLNRTLYVA